MDCTFDTIQGFKHRLPQHLVFLPLKYDSEPCIQPPDTFSDSLAVIGGVVDVSTTSDQDVSGDPVPPGINMISYQINNSLRTIELIPMAFNPSALGLSLRRFSISLQSPLFNQNCVSVVYSPPLPVHKEGLIVVDAIDSNHLFVSIKFRLSDFFVSSPRHFTMDTFLDWGHICVPYSFDLTSPPYLLKAVDPHNLVVSLHDGSLLHFERQRLLDAFDVYSFSDTASILPLRFISSFFLKSTSPQNVIVKGVSSNALVDAVRISDSLIATLTSSKVLQFWDMLSHRSAHPPLALNRNALTNTWLPAAAAKYMQVFSGNSSNTILALHFFDDAENPIDSGHAIKSFEITLGPTTVCEARFSLEPQYPDLPSASSIAKREPAPSVLWFIQDFCASVTDSELMYNILWKSNTASVVASYCLSLDTGAVESCTWLAAAEKSLADELISSHDAQYYKLRVLDSGRYESEVVLASLNVIRSHGSAPNIDFRKSVRDNTNETVLLLASQFHGIDALWFKIWSLCEEFYSLGESALALTMYPHGAFVLQANGFSLSRPIHRFERVALGCGETAQLVQLLIEVSNCLSIRTKHKLLQALQSGIDLEDDASKVYNAHLASKVSAEQARFYVNELGGIANVSLLIESLILPPPPPDRSSAITTHLGTIGKQLAMETFRSVEAAHAQLLFQLATLLLLCDVDPQIARMLCRITSVLRAYSVSNIVFDSCFRLLDPALQIECKDVNKPYQSLLWPLLEQKVPSCLQLVRYHRNNDAYDTFFEYAVPGNQNSDLAVDAIFELLRRGDSLYVEDNYFAILGDSIVDRFLKGLVYLFNNKSREFIAVFESDEFLDGSLNSLRQRLECFSQKGKTDGLSRAIYSDEPDRRLKLLLYYHALSQLARVQSQQTRRHLHRTKYITPTSVKSVHSVLIFQVDFECAALHFEQKALTAILERSCPEDRLTIDTYRANIFEFAMSSADWDLAARTLEHLDTENLGESVVDFVALFTRFVQKLVESQNIAQLYADAGQSLYRKHYLLVDNILLEMANSELTLLNLLRIYKYVYSWRLFGALALFTKLGDTRGAVEALYIFIARFKSEHGDLITHYPQTFEDVAQYRLQILELYMIIINCIKLLHDDQDRWILARSTDDQRKVLRLTELEVEHRQWVRALQEDLAGGV